MHHEISTNTYSPHLDDNSHRCAAAVYVHQWINNNMSGLSLGDSRRAEASKSTHPLPWGAYYYYRSLVQWSGGFTAPELNTWQWHYIYDISILIPPANFHVRATQKYPWAKWSSNLSLSWYFKEGFCFDQSENQEGCHLHPAICDENVRVYDEKVWPRLLKQMTAGSNPIVTNPERGALRAQRSWVYNTIFSGRLSKMIEKPWLRVKWAGSVPKDHDSCKGILQPSCKTLAKYLKIHQGFFTTLTTSYYDLCYQIIIVNLK